MEGAISKEAFGVNLFEVIKTISGIHALQQQLNNAIHAENKKRELEAHWHEAKLILANLLPTLTDAEMDQVLARYPQVVTL